MQLRHYVEFQKELAVNYCQLAVCQCRFAGINDAFRTGLGGAVSISERSGAQGRETARHDRDLQKQGVTAMPHTFALMPDLTIHNLYNGYWYLGRPTSTNCALICAPCCAKCGPISWVRSGVRTVRLVAS